MITNERQYRITKSQAENFENSLNAMGDEPSDPEIHPVIWQAQANAMQAQLSELQEELREYETLKSGKRRAWVLQSFEDLPRGLIQARIATGMSQQELANQLGLKEQQFQRYEATNYSGASWTRLCEVMRALGVSLKGDFAVAVPVTSPTAFVKKLSAAGIDHEMLFGRILPPGLAQSLYSQVATPGVNDSKSKIARSMDLESGNQDAMHEAASWITRVFRLPQDELLMPAHPVQLDASLVGAPRFKVKRRANVARVTAYTFYAHYLALLVLQATTQPERPKLPQNAKEVWKAIHDGWGEVTYPTALAYVWSLGIPVLPLSGTGGFHGACWRVNGRNVIVLKQSSSSPASWLNDLLHELYHALQEPEKDELDVIEEEPTSEERLRSLEEQKANHFAGVIALNGQADALVDLCIKKADGHIPALKHAVKSIAAEHGAPVDSLANYLAYRISIDANLQGENWWGVAANFQSHGEPWRVAGDVLQDKIDWSALNPLDQGLLERALATPES